jgi:hypothetical protein
VKLVGTIQVPLDLRNPRVSSLAGNSFWTVAALTAWDAGHWEFVKSVDGKIYAIIRVPKNMAATPNAKFKLVFAANATTGNFVVNVSWTNVAEGASINPASLTSIGSQTITVPGTAYYLKTVSFTLGSNPSAEDELVIEIYHNGASGSESLAVNLLLIDAFLEIDVN